MNTSSIMEFGEGDSTRMRPLPRPVPLGSSLVAAAARLKAMRVPDRPGMTYSKPAEWQEDAWDMHDLVGEQRYLAHTLAGRMAQARFFVARLPDEPTADIEPTDEELPNRVFDSLAGQRAAFAQMVERQGVNLFIAGDGYLVGTPRPVDPTDGIPPPRNGVGLDGVDIFALDWRMLSVSEVSFEETKQDEIMVKIAMGPGRRTEEYSLNEAVVLRVWRPHPRRWWEAESPTRSSLPVLRELVGLTMHIGAQVDSRLAGAGLFLIPQSADAALRAEIGQEAPDASEQEGISPLAETLMEAMITPINDRAAASALVPVMPVVPDESIEKFRFISFAVPLDDSAKDLRDEAIRRLALGQDAPPEILLGVGGMNHWGAWLVREDVVTTHLEPPLALICDAITTQFLWPVLEQQGMPDFEKFVIWYDVSHLIRRPDRAGDAKDLHALGVINDAALRAANGFDDRDAPDASAVDPAVQMALQMITSAPTLAQEPGLPELVRQIRAAMDGEEIKVEEIPVAPVQPEPSAEPNSQPEQGPPGTDGGTEMPDDLAASAAPVRYTPIETLGLTHRDRSGEMMVLSEGKHDHDS